MASFLRDKTTQKAAIIAVQEPFRIGKEEKPQSWTTHYPNKATHRLIHLKATETDNKRARVCMYVSKDIDPATWSCQTISRDYQLLKVRRNHQEGWTDLFVHNIYNDKDGVVAQLAEELRKREQAEHVVLGDLNLHHPAWGGEGVRASSGAEDLIKVMEKYGLELATEVGKPTWQRNDQSSVIDLIFMTTSLLNRLVGCGVDMNQDHDSDHFPVTTTIDVETPAHEPPKRRNWKATDVNKLTEFINEHLTCRDLSKANAMRIEIESMALVKVISGAVEASTP